MQKPPGHKAPLSEVADLIGQRVREEETAQQISKAAEARVQEEARLRAVEQAEAQVRAEEERVLREQQQQERQRNADQQSLLQAEEQARQEAIARLVAFRKQTQEDANRSTGIPWGLTMILLVLVAGITAGTYAVIHSYQQATFAEKQSALLEEQKQIREGDERKNTQRQQQLAKLEQERKELDLRWQGMQKAASARLAAQRAREEQIRIANEKAAAAARDRKAAADQRKLAFEKCKGSDDPLCVKKFLSGRGR